MKNQAGVMIMQPKFIELCYSKEPVPQKTFIAYHLFPAHIRIKLEEKYRWKKFICERISIQLCGQPGQKVSLPYTEKQWRLIDKNKAMEKLYSLLEKENISFVAAQRNLREYLPAHKVVTGQQLREALLKQWIDFLIRKHDILRKEMRLLIIDGGSKDVCSILKNIYQDVNYMTICTERKEHFEPLLEDAFNQTGLMIEMLSKESTDGMQADIVIDFEKNEKNVYRLYPKRSIVIDMEAGMKKTEYIKVKRSDIWYHDRLFLRHGNEIFGDDLVQAALSGTHDPIKDENPEYYIEELRNYDMRVSDNSCTIESNQGILM